MGQNCLRNLSYYLDKYRPNAEELADWGSAGEDHLFLSETRQPLTKNGMEMLFKRLKECAGITGKRKYSPGDHIPTRMPGPRETRRKGSQAKG